MTLAIELAPKFLSRLGQEIPPASRPKARCRYFISLTNTAIRVCQGDFLLELVAYESSRKCRGEMELLPTFL